MKSAITQMTKFLERKEAKEKCRYAIEVRHMEDTVFTRCRLSLLRMALTEARRLERTEQANSPVRGKR